MTTGPRNNGRTGSPRRGPTGFTLMELVLVLVVVSVVLALSAPSLRGFFVSRQTADAARTMLALIQWGQSEAASQGCPCRLNVDPASGTYWLTVQRGGAYVPLESEMGRRFQLPEGATVTVRSDSVGDDANPCVQFYPNRRSDVAVIEITGRQGDLFQVTCPSATEPFRVIAPSEAQ